MKLFKRGCLMYVLQRMIPVVNCAVKFTPDPGAAKSQAPKGSAFDSHAVDESSMENSEEKETPDEPSYILVLPPDPEPEPTPKSVLPKKYYRTHSRRHRDEFRTPRVHPDLGYGAGVDDINEPFSPDTVQPIFSFQKSRYRQPMGQGVGGHQDPVIALFPARDLAAGGQSGTDSKKLFIVPDGPIINGYLDDYLRKHY